MFGHSIVAKLLAFLGPSAQTAGAVVPIFAILVICLGLVLKVSGFGAYERFVLFALAFAFRLQLWIFGLPAPWRDLFRVDILNCMGFSIAVLSIR